MRGARPRAGMRSEKSPAARPPEARAIQGGSKMTGQNRRRFLTTLLGAGAASAFVPARFAIGQQAKIKLGLMLPYSGTYAALGANITDALKLRITEGGGKLGGRDVEYVQGDDEPNPAKA